jgi:hypothetical protein
MAGRAIGRDYIPVKQLSLFRIDGATWVPFGAPIDGRLTLR